eukprot:s368_g21.t1
MEWWRAYHHKLLRRLKLCSKQVTASHSSCLFEILMAMCSSTACTVCQLLQAQRISLDWNEAGGITLDGLSLPLATFLDHLNGPYELISFEGLNHLAFCSLASDMQGSSRHFIFGLVNFFLRPLGQQDIHEVTHLVDAEGKTYED